MCNDSILLLDNKASWRRTGEEEDTSSTFNLLLVIDVRTCAVN